jgi:putative transposase
MSLRKALKPRAVFRSEEAALKVMYLALRNVVAKWERPIHGKAALNRFTVLDSLLLRSALRAYRTF